MYLTLQNQLRLMGILTVLLLGGIIAFSTLNLRALQQEFLDYQGNRDTHQAIVEIKAAALSVARADPILPETETQLKAVDDQVQSLFAKVTASLTDKQAAKEVKSELSLWNDYTKGINGAIKIAEDSPMDALNIPDAMYKLKLAPLVEKLDAMATAFEKSDTTARERIDATMSRILRVVVMPLLVVAAAIVIFQLTFSHALQRRLSGIIEVVGKLREGDLRHRLPSTSRRDEIARLSEVVNGFIDNFVHILNGVKQAATTTEATAREVEGLSHKANANAEAQSDRFYQVSSAIEQISQTLAEMVNTVEHASNSANETRATVSQGNNSGQETVSAMNRIDDTMADSSRTIGELEAAIERIGNVSNIIREIAEQTNLLALNAAIEAARAGEHGRGFAVVADEVRTLANRTSDSINDITDIVDTIQQNTIRASTAMSRTREEVHSGVRFGEEMVGLLAEIDKSAQCMSGLMQTIAAATEEQSATSNEIARNVEAVSEITTSTKRDIEATRSAVGNLVEIATQLRSSVDRFQLSG